MSTVPVKCTYNQDCPRNTVCDGGLCRPPCATNDECALTESCARGQCTNPCSSDAACGLNAVCQMVRHEKQCSCPPGYRGNPLVLCQPECTNDAGCPLQQACIGQKCRDPCPGSCGVGAECFVVNHAPICTCPVGYTGDPMTQCAPEPITRPPGEAGSHPFLMDESLVCVA